MRLVKLALVAMLVALAGVPCTALGQTAYLQLSGIAGQGTTLTISRLPVVSKLGTISYYDASIGFVVSAAGVPSQVAAPTFKLSPNLVTNHFTAGRYFVNLNGILYGTLSYGVGSGGSTVWTLLMDRQSAPVPQQAVWQTGSPAPDVLARLNAVKMPANPTTPGA